MDVKDKDPLLSRRDFLKLGALGIATLGIPGVSRNLNTEVEATSAKDSLSKAGLEDFEGAYTEGLKSQMLFGNNAGYFGDLLKTLNLVASSQISINSAEVVKLKDGWSKSKPEAFVGKAFTHIGEMTLDTSQAGGDVSEFGVRKLLGKYASSFPVLILALPLNVKIVNAGFGHADHDLVTIVSTSDSNENMRVILHEGTHEADTWRRSETKSFIERLNFAEYLRTYLSTTYDFIVNEWAKGTNVQVLHYFRDKPIVGVWEKPINTSQEDINDINSQIVKLQNKFGLETGLKPGGNPTEDQAIAAWNILLKSVVNGLIRFSDSDRSAFIYNHINDLTAMFFNGISSSAKTGARQDYRLEGLVTEVMHHFVNPVFTDEQASELEHPLVKAQLTVQKARLKVCSTLGNNTDFAGIRKALGLS